MCGGASKVLLRDMHIPQDLQVHFTRFGLITAQDILDEGVLGLRRIGTKEDDITVLEELIQKEVNEQLI